MGGGHLIKSPALNNLFAGGGKNKYLKMIAQLLATCSCFILSNGFSVDTNLIVDGSCPKDVLYEDMCPSVAKDWRLDSVCTDVASIIGPALRVCLSPVGRKFQVTIRVEIEPHQVGQAQGSLWMSGRGPTLSWETATEVKKDPLRPSAWNVDIEYVMDSDSVKCFLSSQCTGLQNAIEFRLNLDKGLGPRGDMLGPNFYISLPVSNSMRGSLSGARSHVTVYPWFSGVRRQVKQYYRSFEGMDANFSIFFPASFDSSVGLKKYPLVVVLGKEASRVLPPLIDAIYSETLAEEAVVVFFDKWGIEVQDMQCNYSPYRQKSVSDERKHCQTCWDSDPQHQRSLLLEHTYERHMVSISCRSHGGELLLEFISTQLVEVVQAETNERVMFDPPRYRISVIGHGMMGLLSCHAAITRPYFFGSAGCMSAPFYWPLDNSFGAQSGFRKALKSNIPLTAEQKSLHCTQKYYIDVGEWDDSTGRSVKEAKEIIGTMKHHFMLKDSENVLFFVVPNTSSNSYSNQHLRMDEENLISRFHSVLHYILRPEGGPRRNRLSEPTEQPYVASSTNSSHLLSYSCSKGISLPVFLCSIGKEIILCRF